MITTKVSLQLVDQTVPAIIPVVQGDTGRSIIFEPSDFTIPEGATATYYIQKPSGEAVYNSAEITGNTVVCNLTAQSIIETGENNVQVRIILGEDIVTSFDAILMVRPFRGIGAVESKTEINIFDKAVEEAEQEISDKADEIIAEKVPELEAIVEEVIESIPADYTALTNKVSAMLADMATEFSAEATYQPGDIVIYGNDLYRKKNGPNITGEWIAAQWEAITLGSAIEQIVGNLAPQYDQTATYHKDDAVIYLGDLYICTSTLSVTGTWDASKWSKTDVSSLAPAVDATLTQQGKPADAKAVGDEIADVKADLTELSDVVDYGLNNLTPYDTTKITVQYATLETPEYEHGYTIKASGSGSATPRLSYTLPNTPDIESTDIMYLSFEMYIDAEASEYTANLYQPKSFGHTFGNTPIAAKQWVTVQRRYTHGSTITAVGFSAGVSFSSTTVAKNKLIHLRNMVSVNLTKSYGVGKEPTIEEMNAIVAENDGYFGKLNLFDARQITDDVSKLKTDMSDVWDNAFVNIVNGYITAHPSDANEGDNYISNASGTSVSMNAGVGTASAGDIIYVYGEISPYSQSDNCNQLEISNNTGRAGELSQPVVSPQNGVWYPISGMVEVTSGTKSLVFSATWEQSASIRMYTRHVVAINLTSIFGQYNEPTKEALDKYFYAVSVANAMDFGAENSKMLNLTSTSRKILNPHGSYVMLDNDGNVKMGSVPYTEWNGWSEIGTYGQNRLSNIPIYNQVHGTIETDGMMSVIPIYGCWSDEAASTGNSHHGGHVFHGWTTDRMHRLTMTQNIYSDNEASVFNYIPGDKSDTSEGVFLPLRLGADNVYKGVLLTPYYDPENASNYRYTRMTVYGRLNITRPQNYNHIPASASADGVKGDICFDENYVYFCVADNTWKRIALSAWN